MFTSLLPATSLFAGGIAISMFQSSGKSYLPINRGGFAVDADDGRNVLFSLELCPPSAMSPPRSNENVPIPDVPPLPTSVPSSTEVTSLPICSHIDLAAASDIWR